MLEWKYKDNLHLFFKNINIIRYCGKSLYAIVLKNWYCPVQQKWLFVGILNNFPLVTLIFLQSPPCKIPLRAQYLWVSLHELLISSPTKFHYGLWLGQSITLCVFFSSNSLMDLLVLLFPWSTLFYDAELIADLVTESSLDPEETNQPQTKAFPSLCFTVGSMFFSWNAVFSLHLLGVCKRSCFLIATGLIPESWLSFWYIFSVCPLARWFMWSVSGWRSNLI